MLFIDRPQTNPYFNIAAEEYLLKNADEDGFMVWQNEPSVIVGKHQNTLAEIDHDMTSTMKIPVIRRISGGGAVYHDEGNLNFTFISKGETGKLVDFSRFIVPVVEALNRIGVPAQHFGKNDIRANGFKISGNSEHVHRDKVLHHGTLLFNSDLEILNKILRIKSGFFYDKSVRSVRSNVRNISTFLDGAITFTDFRNLIADQIIRKFPGIGFHKLSETEIAGINDLVERKYKTWKWNFGYSPDYVFKNKIIYSGNVYTVELKVKQGIIIDYKIGGIKNRTEDLISLNKILIGVKHERETINEQIFLLKRTKETYTFDANFLLELLF